MAHDVADGKDVRHVGAHLDVNVDEATVCDGHVDISISKEYFIRYNIYMASNQKIPAIFYRSASGDEPVRDWLKALDKTDCQVIGEDIAYVQYK